MTKEVAFTRYLQLLHRLSVTKYENLDQLLAAYLSAGCEIFAASCGAVTAANNVPLSTFGEASEDTRAAEVAASRQTMLSSSPLYIGASILVGDTVHAVISFWSDVDVPALDPHAREIIELMAKSIAAAMHQRQLTDQLAFQANHDALNRVAEPPAVAAGAGRVAGASLGRGPPSGGRVHRSRSLQAHQRHPRP
jgi:hypothetical protein